MAKTKQQAADEAYRRAEAQRALVVVLDAAVAWERENDATANGHAIGEAIATVRAHFLTVSEPPKEPAVKTLAGQIDLVDGSVEGDYGGYVELPNVPPTCPRCGRDNSIVFGGGWTAMSLGDTSGPRPQLQCGGCSFIQSVSLAAWTVVREERRRTIGAADRAPKKADRGAKKTRGAG